MDGELHSEPAKLARTFFKILQLRGDSDRMMGRLAFLAIRYSAREHISKTRLSEREISRRKVYR
jgi:hypothetical protein